MIDPYYEERSDRNAEIRHLVVGTYESRVLAVVYTKRGKKHRIISVRRARKNEEEIYKKIVQYKSENLPKVKINWKKVDKLSSKKLDDNARSDPDSFLADEDFWTSAKLVMPERQEKERITIRIDSNILQWFRQHGDGYQSKIYSILKSFVETYDHMDSKNQTHPHR